MKDLFKKTIIKIITWQAKIILKKKNPKIIAVTGNLGKTTTKDFIYAALHRNLLSEKREPLVLASKKSMNSDSGIPLTILKLDTGWDNPFLWIKIILKGFKRIFSKYTYKYLILEIGADTPGDIKKVCEYIKPDITVITGFAPVPVHIEFFDNDREKLIREKKYLVENLKENGTLIYNLDDEDCIKIADEYKDKNINFKTFSLENIEADIIAKNITIEKKEINKYLEELKGVSAQIYLKDKEPKDIEIKETLGKAIFYSLLPALLISEIFNIDLDNAISDIEDTKRTNGRMRILKGVYNTNIIDDTYNSSPKALKHGIDMMRDIDIKGKKIFVLGDMLELGDFTREEHESIGKYLVGICDILITSGIRAKMIGESAIQNGMNGENVYITTNSLEAGKELLRILEDEIEKDYKEGRSEEEIGGDLIFVKGSQGSRMEKVVRMILDKNHNPETELVRQDKMWRMK